MPSPNKLGVLGALAPVPLVAILSAYDWSNLISRISQAYWFALISVASAILTGTFLLRARKPQYLISRGSAQWLLLTLGGGVTYLSGSYYGSTLLHWAGIPLVYFGLVAYLCGSRFGAFILPPLAVLSTIIIPSYSGPLASSVAAAALLLYSGLVLRALRNYRTQDMKECELCPSYRASGFCEYCGKRVAQKLSFPLPTRRLILVVIISAVVVAPLVQLTVPVVNLTGSGLQVESYQPSGLQRVTDFMSYPGWTPSLVAAQSNQSLTTFSYQMTGNESVIATLSLSSSSKTSSGGALSFYNDSTLVGEYPLTPGQAALQYAWVQNGMNYTGLLVQSPMTYLSGGAIIQASASFFYVEPMTGGSTPTGITELANATSNELQGVRSGYPFLTQVLSPVSSNFQYVMLVSALIFFGLIGGIARSTDSEAARRFDNSLGLSGPEMDMLSVIASGPKNFTKKDLVERIAERGDPGVTASFPEKLLRSGLATKEIVTAGGLPKLTWTIRVTS